jgi:hypothetical protein
MVRVIWKMRALIGGERRLSSLTGDRAGRCLRLSLTFGHGILEVYAAPSAAPPQPHTGKYPVGQIPEAGRSRSKSPQATLRLWESQSILSEEPLIFSLL